MAFLALDMLIWVAKVQLWGGHPLMVDVGEHAFFPSGMQMEAQQVVNVK